MSPWRGTGRGKKSHKATHGTNSATHGANSATQRANSTTDGPSRPAGGASGASRPADEATGPSRPADEATGASRPADEATGASRPADEATGASRPADEATGASRPADEASRASRPADEATGASRPADEATGASRPADEASRASRPADEASRASRPADEATGGPEKNRPENNKRKRPKIHPLSGVVLAAILTVPVVALGLQRWPAENVHVRAAHSQNRGVQGRAESVRAATNPSHGVPRSAQAAAPRKASRGGRTTAGTATPTAPAAPMAAPGAPGTTSSFDLARKDCVGTAAPNGGQPSSKVWYTVADGVLSDVYQPTIDNTNVGTLQYVVTDGATFTDLQTRDLTYTVSADSSGADPSGMTCTVTATSTKHGYRLVTTYLTDPVRDTLLMRTRLEAIPGSHTDLRALRVYARLDAHVNGNGGGGSANGGADTGIVENTAGAAVPVVYDTSVTSQAVNRDYAVPTYMALTSTSPSQAASVGYAGAASDGLTQLDASHALTTRYTSAPDGHIIATEDVTPAEGAASTGGAGDGTVTLALGFGRSLDGALATTAGTLRQPFGSVLDAYQQGWSAYDAGLNRPPATLPGLPSKDQARVRAAYYLSANVLKASEDKTFPGAVVASLASPWGQAVSGGAAPGGKAVYFGSYREVFSRDLYETFTGLLVDGDLATARAATRFLFDRQQLPTGEIPRNSLLNGEAAPDTGGDQLDETSYPILMAYQAGLGGDTALWKQRIIPAADFLVAHGPSFGVERWEEQPGYSPPTIAAEIAGLTAAAAIATRQGDGARAQVYQATADDFQRMVKTWTVTTTGPDGPRYFIRVSKTGDPNAAISYSLGNGGPALDQRTVLDGGFQELVRLGELPVSAPDVRASLGIWDKMISVSTPSGTGYYRYGNAATDGSTDGYGDCYQPSQTSCSTPGQPWPTTDAGTGHPWPLLSGERAESDIASADLTDAASLLTAMMNFSSGVGLVPEQVWEDPDLAAAPYGTDPTTASIGFTDGKPAGSAAPLSWAQAQELRLIADLGTGRILEQPAITADRYVRHAPPAAVPVTLTPPAGGSAIESSSTIVTGTTTPGAKVVVEAADTDPGPPTTTVNATATADGSFAAKVPAGSGANVLTVTAATATGTGYAQTTAGDTMGGAKARNATDPAGGNNGPGTVQHRRQPVQRTRPGLGPSALPSTRPSVLGPTLNPTLGPTLAPTLGPRPSDRPGPRPSAGPSARGPTLGPTPGSP